MRCLIKQRSLILLLFAVHKPRPCTAPISSSPSPYSYMPFSHILTALPGPRSAHRLTPTGASSNNLPPPVHAPTQRPPLYPALHRLLDIPARLISLQKSRFPTLLLFRDVVHVSMVSLLSPPPAFGCSRRTRKIAFLLSAVQAGQATNRACSPTCPIRTFLPLDSETLVSACSQTMNDCCTRT